MSVKAIAQSVTATAETNIQNPSGTNLTLGMPAWKSIFDGKAFCLRIAGYVTTDATATANVKMYYSSTAAGAKTTQIGATGASNSLATTSANFNLELWLMWDSVSTSLYGQQYGWAGTTVLGGTALTNTATFADISAGVWFQPTVTFSAVTAAATIKVIDFGIDVV